MNKKLIQSKLFYLSLPCMDETYIKYYLQTLNDFYFLIYKEFIF
jgi:hypothetical protein